MFQIISTWQTKWSHRESEERENHYESDTESLSCLFLSFALKHLQSIFMIFLNWIRKKCVRIFFYKSQFCIYTSNGKKIVKKKLFMIPITMRWNGMKWHIDQSSKWNKIENFCYLLTVIFNEFMLESFIFGEFANKNWNILSRIRIYLNDETHIQILMCMRLWCRHS